MPPLELLASGRAEVAGYGGTILAGTVASLARLPGGGFAVTLADGTSRGARRVLVATGLVDEYPDLAQRAHRYLDRAQALLQHVVVARWSLRELHQIGRAHV